MAGHSVFDAKSVHFQKDHGKGTGFATHRTYVDNKEVTHRDYALQQHSGHALQAYPIPPALMGGIGVLTRPIVPKFFSLSEAAIKAKGESLQPNDRFALADVYPVFREMTDVLGYPEEMVAKSIADALYNSSIGEKSGASLNTLVQTLEAAKAAKR